MLLNKLMTPTIDLIRRQNLKTLSSESGGIGKLAERLGKDPSQVSQWINASLDSRTGRPRGIRSRTCRDIEAVLGKPEGWMDVDHSASPSLTETGWPFAEISQDRYAQLPDRVKGLIEGRVLAMIEDWEAGKK